MTTNMKRAMMTACLLALALFGFTRAAGAQTCPPGYPNYCGDDSCCPTGYTCGGDCGGECCGTSTGGDPGGTCPAGYPVDCGNGSCCPSGYTCGGDCGGECCGASSSSGGPGGSGGTCPAGYPVNCDNGSCCPSGYSCGVGTCVADSATGPTTSGGGSGDCQSVSEPGCSSVQACVSPSSGTAYYDADGMIFDCEGTCESAAQQAVAYCQSKQSSCAVTRVGDARSSGLRQTAWALLCLVGLGLALRRARRGPISTASRLDARAARRAHDVPGV